MTPDLAQVLNTVAHEIRTPLAVSQGYLKLFLDGRLKEDAEIRRAMEQTRQALGTLATLCVDMGKVSSLSESAASGIPERVSTADFIAALRGQADMKRATWSGEGGAGMIATSNSSDLAQAVAVVSKTAFDEARDEAHAIRADVGADLVVVAGVDQALPALQAGPDAPAARAVDFGKGGKGLKLIWAAFVLDRHGVQTWTLENQKASVGFRIPLVQA